MKTQDHKDLCCLFENSEVYLTCSMRHMKALSQPQVLDIIAKIYKVYFEPECSTA